MNVQFTLEGYPKILIPGTELCLEVITVFVYNMIQGKNGMKSYGEKPLSEFKKSILI